MSMESLWPQLGNLSQDVPVQILKAQADIFNREMKGILECEVSSSEISTKGVFIPGIDKDFTSKLIVTSPQLINYSLVLVQVNNFIARAYPCEVINCVNDNQVNSGITANNADDFKRILGSILKSQEVVIALQNLIAQTENL